MRLVLRGLFTGLAILSLLLMAATAGLWARSYGVRDSLRVRVGNRVVVGAFASRGAVAIGWGARGRLPISHVEYTRRWPIDPAGIANAYGEVYGFPGVAALQIGPGRFVGYRVLVVLHDAVLIVLLAVLPLYWAIRLPWRPAGRPCGDCGFRVIVRSEPCPQCGAKPAPTPPREPSAGGPLVRVVCVMIALIAFFVWVWQYGGARRGGSHGGDDSAPARVWQVPPGAQ